MFREKYYLILALTFFMETATLVLFMFLTRDWFKFWFWNIWLDSLWVVAGLDFGLVFYYGWEYLNPTETRLPVYVGLSASLVVGLIIKGVALLIG